MPLTNGCYNFRAEAIMWNCEYKVTCLIEFKSPKVMTHGLI